ncbi:hypothetical protein CZ794_08685 [Psychrobacter sp. JB385]|nr:hypothetical protein CZ794_08685 [Psychrobacter sp. JB385]
MLSLNQAASAKQMLMIPLKKCHATNTSLSVGVLITMLSLSACQTAPSMSTTAQSAPMQASSPSQGQTSKAVTMVTVTPVTQAPIVRADDESDDAIESDDSSESSNPLTQETPTFNTPSAISIPSNTIILPPSRDDYMISEPIVPSRNELLEQARKNSQQRTQKAISNNSDLPAFRNLMQTGINQLKSGNLTNAENSFTRAQRLAPKSSAVYFYLAQVALKKNQPRKAEAMARRGLTVSQDSGRRQALWQIILQSGQAQGNSRVVREAKQALR